MTRTRAALLLAGIFVLGLACGAFGMATYGIHRFHRMRLSPEKMQKFVVRRIAERLDLDDSQRLVLEDVVRRAGARIEQVRGETTPKYEAILDDADRELRPVLRPEQQKELDAIRAEAEERLHRHRS